jgi:hypothetical protein
LNDNLSSIVLSRLSSFLPQLAQANDELFNAIQESGDVEAFNIESVDDESPYIEMASEKCPSYIFFHSFMNRI